MSQDRAVALLEVYEDFILAKQSILVSKGMIRIYNFTLKKFVVWLIDKGVTLDQLHARHVRGYLSELSSKNLSDSYIHCFARTIKTFLRFLYHEEHTPKLITFEMPPVRETKLDVLTAKEFNKVLSFCTNLRDRALLLFMVDTGLRRSEVCSLKWYNVDLKSGVVVLERGKWHKPRSVVMGKETRKILTQYKSNINPAEEDSVFQTLKLKPLTPNGLRTVLLKISKKAGIHFSPHVLRRTFATLSIRAGMNPFHLQSLMGHSTLEMTRRYTRLVEDDFIKAHEKFGPIDKFIDK